MRIPFGLDRLPRGIAPDDPRLPAVEAGAAAVRLNNVPLPQEAMETAGPTSAARLAAMMEWLQGQCGDYAPARRRFVAAYLGAVAGEVAAARTVLADGLRHYDGLYAPEDWVWSAPRPLPRAWLPAPEGPVMAEIAFWDGTRALAIDLSARDTPRLAALRAAGVEAVRLGPEELADPVMIAARLPGLCHAFWDGQTLPVSPFRRAIPRGVVDA